MRIKLPLLVIGSALLLTAERLSGGSGLWATRNSSQQTHYVR